MLLAGSVPGVPMATFTERGPIAASNLPEWDVGSFDLYIQSNSPAASSQMGKELRKKKR
jgi:hypothetical protein